MKWVWKIEPLDPATATVEEVASAGRMHSLGVQLGAIVGILAAVGIYYIWGEFDQTAKWVDYTRFPAIAIGGCALYRLVYEFVIRFRP